MALGILGTKLGMTQVFDEEHRQVTPVTVIQAEPNVVLRQLTKDKDGYSAVQVAYGVMKPQRANKPHNGQFVAAGAVAGQDIATRRHVCEFRLDADPGADLGVGAEVRVDRFEGQKFVDVAGTSKGRGFAGVMKRHNFAGFERSHGVHEYFRHGGSIGTRLTPGHVFKGKRMGGHMGSERVTTQNLRLLKVDTEKNLLFVVGAVPGSKGSLVEVKPAVKKG